jgi:hypothetical protein
MAQSPEPFASLANSDDDKPVARIAPAVTEEPCLIKSRRKYLLFPILKKIN